MNCPLDGEAYELNYKTQRSNLCKPSEHIFARTYFHCILMMFLFANLSQALWGKENQAFVILLPLALIIFFVLANANNLVVRLPKLVSVFLVFSLILYCVAFTFPDVPYSNSFVWQWHIHRSGFVVNLICICASAIIAAKYPFSARAVLVKACRYGIFVSFFLFVLYLSHQLDIFELPDRFIVYSGDRFGGLFKEPVEATFFIFFALLISVWQRRLVDSILAAVMLAFTKSNLLPLLISTAIVVYIIVKVRRGLLVPTALTCFLALTIFLMFITPDPIWFSWIEPFFPRASNLYVVRETPQRLWTNWIAVQDFKELHWPLGGGAGYLRVYDSPNYFFDTKVVFGGGAGVFKFLSDFGILGLLFLFWMAKELAVSTQRTAPNKWLISALFSCLLFMSFRTGYFNISVWTLVIMVFAACRLEIGSHSRRM